MLVGEQLPFPVLQYTFDLINLELLWLRDDVSYSVSQELFVFGFVVEG